MDRAEVDRGNSFTPSTDPGDLRPLEDAVACLHAGTMSECPGSCRGRQIKLETDRPFARNKACPHHVMELWETEAITQFLVCCSVTQSCPAVCDPMDCSMPGLPAITNSWSLLKFMSIKSVMPSNCLILCHPLLLLPSVFPSISIYHIFFIYLSVNMLISTFGVGKFHCMKIIIITRGCLIAICILYLPLLQTLQNILIL